MLLTILKISPHLYLIKTFITFGKWNTMVNSRIHWAFFLRGRASTSDAETSMGRLYVIEFYFQTWKNTVSMRRADSIKHVHTYAKRINLTKHRGLSIHVYMEPFKRAICVLQSVKHLNIWNARQGLYETSEVHVYANVCQTGGYACLRILCTALYIRIITNNSRMVRFIQL